MKRKRETVCLSSVYTCMPDTLHSFHTLIHAFTNSLTHPLSHSFIHSFTQLARFYLVAKIFRQRHVCVYVCRYMFAPCLSVDVYLYRCVCVCVCMYVCVWYIFHMMSITVFGLSCNLSLVFIRAGQLGVRMSTPCCRCNSKCVAGGVSVYVYELVYVCV